jgi:hypothetical protein
MAISINPIFPVIAAQGVPADVVLQPGTVIDAQVLKVLANNAVRIAIANLSIEVMSEIPLQVGQALRLAVSQMPEGIRLAVVGQAGNAATSAAPTDMVTLAPDAPVSATAKPAAVATAANGPLTALEALAVSAAAQVAATKQAGLSQLFVNLDAASASENLPPNVQQAALQLLGQRLPLDAALSGNHIKTAFQDSGLFLEQTLAAGLVPSAASGAIPDLKAALLVFKQLLSLQLGKATTAEAALSSVTAQQTLPAGVQKNAATDTSTGMAPFGKMASPPSAPSLMPELDVQEILLPQARVPVAEDVARVGGRFGPAAGTPLDAAASRIALNLLQETLSTTSGAPRPTAIPPGASASDDAAFARTNTPPPPIRAALPVAQGGAVPSIAVGASSTEVLHRLLADTDAALARQTLLQVASLPDRSDLASARNDPAVPRWNFEIPFTTALGTAVAQFEIAHDGGGSEAEAAKRIWRARFSLDIEPAGPVHALVSLTGNTTSVRMWAERPATANQLRAGAAQLSQALSLAELTPGDIVIREGAPPQTAAAQAGHFLDRAL